MALVSRLFKGDAALEACQLRDSAHLVEGARGPHVSKIHTALLTLEDAPIGSAEIDGAIYGRSTADAVLAYKRKRGIINPAYQTQADNIVGKMTITRLDTDMAEAESRTCGRCCPDPQRGGPPPRPPLERQLAIGDAPRPQFPAIIAVEIRIVLIQGNSGPFDLQLVAELTKRANELLAPFGQKLLWVPGLTISFPSKVAYNDNSRITALRKLAGANSASGKNFLTVLVVPFCDSTDSTKDDQKNFGVSHGRATQVDGFDNFVQINSNVMRPDRGTLLHEMIHCSRDDMMFDMAHREEIAGNVFSSSGFRDRMLPEHARLLRSANFAFPR